MVVDQPVYYFDQWHDRYLRGTLSVEDEVLVFRGFLEVTMPLSSITKIEVDTRSSEQPFLRIEYTQVFAKRYAVFTSTYRKREFAGDQLLSVGRAIRRAKAEVGTTRALQTARVGGSR